MTLQQLYCFRTLSKTCHFTKAADELFISQSSLSYAIAELEKELNVRLFERRGNKTFLSKYGERFLEDLGPALELIEQATVNVKEMGSVSKGNIRLGIIPTLLRSFSHRIIKDFYASHPESLIDIKIFDTSNGHELISALELGRVDIAITSIPKGTMENIVLFDQRFCLYVSLDHPLATRGSVSLSDIEQQGHIALSRGGAFRAQLDAICQRKRLRYRIINEQDSCGSVMSFVSNGLGVAILPYSRDYEAYGYGSKALDIDDPDFCRTIFLSWMKDARLSAAVELVKDFLIENSADIYNSLLMD